MKLSSVILCPPDFSTGVCGESMRPFLPAGSLLLLEGPTGIGKTELVRGFLRSLGFKGQVNSPTFVTHQVYYGEGWRVFHGDMDRLPPTGDDPDFIEPLLEDRVYSWSFVEWGDKLPSSVHELFPVVGCLSMSWEGEGERVLTLTATRGEDHGWVRQWESVCRKRVHEGLTDLLAGRREGQWSL